MSRRSSNSRWSFALKLLGASILVHLLLWRVADVMLLLDWGKAPLPIGGGVMEVALVPAGPTPPRPEESKPEAVEPDGKIVNLDRVIDERPAPDTDLVSEFDSRVDQQTRAPNRRPVPGDSPVRPGQAPDAAQGQTRTATEAQRSSSTRSLPLGRATDQDSTGKRGDDAIPTADDGRAANDPGRAGVASKRGLRGTPDAFRRSFGTPGSFDHLPGVDEGQENLLNTRRFRFSSFFNRVRDAIAQHWHPEVLHASRDPDGRIHGTKTRITRLRITLNPNGSVKKIRLVAASGVGYLDEEAIRAVRAAQPFQNPPPQLIDKSTGLIDFDFGFIFEITGRTRIHRYFR